MCAQVCSASRCVPHLGAHLLLHQPQDHLPQVRVAGRIPLRGVHSANSAGERPLHAAPRRCQLMPSHLFRLLLLTACAAGLLTVCAAGLLPSIPIAARAHIIRQRPTRRRLCIGVVHRAACHIEPEQSQADSNPVQQVPRQCSSCRLNGAAGVA